MTIGEGLFKNFLVGIKKIPLIGGILVVIRLILFD
jgi:hypothetical protein